MKQTTILKPLPQDKITVDHVSNYKKIQMKLHEISESDNLTYEHFLESLEINHEEYLECIRSSLDQEKIFLKRLPSEIRINPYMTNLITAWQANHDIQFVLDADACAMYIVSYINKSQRGMSELLEKASKECDKGDMTLKSKIRHMGNQFLNHVEVSAQEAIYILLELPLTQSTRSVLFINTSPIEDRVVYLKEKEQLQKLSKKSTDIHKSNDVIRYSNGIRN